MSIFKKKITDSDVLDFLEKNPNFFISHPEILEILEIKHASEMCIRDSINRKASGNHQNKKS